VTEPLLHVDGLRLEIATPRGTVVPSDDVSFAVAPGEVVGLVGESGSGKTMTALATMGMNPAACVRAAGRIVFEGRDVAAAGEAELRRLRGGRIGYVAQDATTALNPVLRVGTQIVETLRAHLDVDRSTARARAAELLRSVGIPEPEARLKAYPHELSGGMRQRVAIAIAISCEPRLVIADEPTTALDVTVQAQVVDALVHSARERGAAVLLISHDLGLISAVTDRTLVMYAGRLIEEGPTARVVRAPSHPYTEALLTATPRIRGAKADRLPAIPGRPPDLAAVPDGCRFAPRCAFAQERCRAEEPRLRDGAPACWFPRPAPVAGGAPAPAPAPAPSPEEAGRV
jgi:peptide/nickel transport system ATP-binding protein